MSSNEKPAFFIGDFYLDADLGVYIKIHKDGRVDAGTISLIYDDDYEGLGWQNVALDDEEDWQFNLWIGTLTNTGEKDIKDFLEIPEVVQAINCILKEWEFVEANENCEEVEKLKSLGNKFGSQDHGGK